MIYLRVNDLKQYAYCPRIVFYQYAMPVEKKATWKMEQGKVEEDRIDQLEKRRQLRAYRLTDGDRKFHFWITSERLGLSGRLDLLIHSPAGLFPVDFKFTTGRAFLNHIFQLSGYALLLEDRYQRPVTKGFIYLIPQNAAEVIDLTPERKAEAGRTLDAIRSMIEEEKMPPPTSVRNRCTDCEYRNYCADIF